MRPVAVAAPAAIRAAPAKIALLDPVVIAFPPLIESADGRIQSCCPRLQGPQCRTAIDCEESIRHHQPCQTKVFPALGDCFGQRCHALPACEVSVDGVLPGRYTRHVCLNVCHKNRYVEVR